MVNLNMIQLFLGDTKPEKGTSCWRVGSSGGVEVKFPSPERIAELWKTHAPTHGSLRVIEDFGNCFAAHIPIGTKPNIRRRFIEALSRETYQP